MMIAKKRNKYFLKSFKGKHGIFKGLVCWKICIKTKHGILPVLPSEYYDPACAEADCSSLNSGKARIIGKYRPF